MHFSGIEPEESHWKCDMLPLHQKCLKGSGLSGSNR